MKTILALSGRGHKMLEICPSSIGIPSLLNEPIVVIHRHPITIEIDEYGQIIVSRVTEFDGTYTMPADVWLPG